MLTSTFVQNKNNVWVEDTMITYCTNCKLEFYIFMRKHHCRYCGNVFCNTCTSKYIIIPDFISDKLEYNDNWNISYYINSLKSDSVRVCDDCYKIIIEKINIYDKIVDLLNNPLSIEKIINTYDLQNNLCSKYYFDHLRNIQYYLPNHKYTEIDKNMLYVNAHNFCSHSKYLTHLIKSIEWDYFDEEFNNKKEEFILKILNSDKIMDCSTLYCTRTCTVKFNYEDCINILYYSNEHLPDKILDILFNRILLVNDEEVIYYLPFFVNLVKNNTINSYLLCKLLTLLKRSEKILYQTYWLLMSNINNNIENENINNFLNLIDVEILSTMKKIHIFYSQLMNKLDKYDAIIYLDEQIKKFKEIPLPYDPSVKIIGFDPKSITIKDSCNKPVIITFNTNLNTKIKIMFKKESSINDLIVMNLINLCSNILKPLLNQDIESVTYNVIPLTSNSSMIEIIDDAETLHQINLENKTIFQYIIENNEDQTVEKILDKFMYSFISYTLHNYMIGLGDRHLENIMIKRNGVIFHIDFDFIMGDDPYSKSSSLKINSGMLSALSGKKKDRYNTYLKLCSKGVIILRKWFDMFFILLNQIPKFNDQKIEKFIMSRFQPRQTDSVVIDELMNIINNSSTDYSNIIRDFVHHHTSEKTIQNGFTKILQKSVDVLFSKSSK